MFTHRSNYAQLYQHDAMRILFIFIHCKSVA